MKQTFLRSLRCLGAFALVTLGSSACTIKSTDTSSRPIGPAAGTFAVRWSISGSFDPSQCDRHRAYTMELAIYDGRGIVANQSAPCSAMSTSLSLDPGSYTGTMTLTDGGETARTTTLDLRPFSVQSYSTTTGDTDFPGNSFY